MDLVAVGVVGIAFAALSCADGAFSTPPPEERSGAHEGTLVQYIATFADGHSERRYGLKGDGASPLRLAFDAPPTATSGTRLRVWGDTENSTVSVSRYEVVSSLSAIDQPARTPSAVRQET